MVTPVSPPTEGMLDSELMTHQQLEYCFARLKECGMNMIGSALRAHIKAMQSPGEPSVERVTEAQRNKVIATMLDMRIVARSSGGRVSLTADNCTEIINALHSSGEPGADPEKMEVPRCPRCQRIARTNLMGGLTCDTCGSSVPSPETKTGDT